MEGRGGQIRRYGLHVRAPFAHIPATVDPVDGRAAHRVHRRTPDQTGRVQHFWGYNADER